ncbi:hypothetical protein [Streptomyces zaomyceticus]|uniref:hypothetical protein n=1 Tax=Streptomyces zaomyceticus TaxID=68286 RepID=UPI0034394CF7
MSLPASSTGWLAAYRSDVQIENKQPGTYLPVDGWDSGGEALVVDAHRGYRRPASHLPHFRGLRQAERGTAGVVPGQGWQVAYLDGATPDVIVAWTVDANGWAVPVIAHGDGWAEPYEATENDFLVPPDCTPDSSPYRPTPEGADK